MVANRGSREVPGEQNPGLRASPSAPLGVVPPYARVVAPRTRVRGRHDPHPRRNHHGHGPPTPEHRRPDGVDDNTVQAVDTVTRALETDEAARGHLVQWHRSTGTAGPTQLREAVEQLRAAGHVELPTA